MPVGANTKQERRQRDPAWPRLSNIASLLEVGGTNLVAKSDTALRLRSSHVDRRRHASPRSLDQATQANIGYNLSLDDFVRPHFSLLVIRWLSASSGGWETAMVPTSR